MTKCDVSRAFGWAILPSHFPTGYYAIQIKEKKVKKEKQKESIKSGLGLIVLSTLSHSTRRNRLNGFRDYNRGNSRLINSVHGMNNATLIDNKRGNGIREGGLFQPHSCSSRRSRGCRADFFSLFLLFLLRGNVIFKKKGQSTRFAHEVTPLLPQRVSKFRGARIICMLLERLKN